MRFTFYLSMLVAPLATIAAPLDSETATNALSERQTALTKPPPCIRNSAVTVSETKHRSKGFARAFIYEHNITEAFTYIVSDYINHNPLAKNGSDSAWSILSPFWGSSDITPLRTTFQNPQSWLNYNISGLGAVVDRFRWEGGCIVEHWDQGEVYPSGRHGQ